MGNWLEHTPTQWQELDMQKLKIDEAYIRLISSSSRSVWLYSLSDVCHKCPYTKILEVKSLQKNNTIISTKYKLFLKVFDVDHGEFAYTNQAGLCRIDKDLGEFGVYNLTVADDKMCRFSIDLEPVNIYLPLILTTTIVFFVCLLYWILNKFYQKLIVDMHQTHVSIKISQIVNERPYKQMGSLDAFRGMAAVLLIFGVSGGGGYWWLRAPWNGLGIMAFIFPAFNWAMGANMVNSLNVQLYGGRPKKDVLLSIAWLSVKQFFAGFCLNSSGPILENLRIMGILQRLGVANLIVGSLYTMTSPRKPKIPQENHTHAFQDIILIRYLWLSAGFVTVVYLLIIFLVQIPGCPRGYSGPGGLHEMRAYENCTGGVTGYVDRIIIGTRRLQHRYPASEVYKSGAFDTDGLLGCLPTIVQTIMGVQCAVTMLVYKDWKSKALRWFCWGVILGLLAGILCMFKKEGGWIPINRYLMSFSFVLLSSSINFIVHALCHILIDEKDLWDGTPFIQCGKNALLIYMGCVSVAKMLPWNWQIDSMNTHFVLLLKSTWSTLIWIAFAIYWQRVELVFVLSNFSIAMRSNTVQSWTEYVRPMIHGLSMNKLNVDEAYLCVESQTNASFDLYYTTEDCYKCLYKYYGKIKSGRYCAPLNVRRQLSFRIHMDRNLYLQSTKPLCQIDPEMGEFGIYDLTIGANRTCNFDVLQKPVNIYKSFILVVLIYLALFSLMSISYWIWKRANSSTVVLLDDDPKKRRVPLSSRLRSIDIFRGIIVVLMIFVNNKGGDYWWTDHATWNGLQLADIVYPCFVWIMGVCIPLSIRSQLKSNVTKIKIILDIFYRSFVLFILGIIDSSAYTSGKLEFIKLIDILQSLAIGYFFAATVHALFASRQRALIPQSNPSTFADILLIKYEWIFGIMLIIIHEAINFGLKVPGCPRGYVGAGGLQDNGTLSNCTGGVSTYIDQLAYGRIVSDTRSTRIYKSSPYYLNSVFDMMMFTAHIFIGVQCGSTLLTFKLWRQRIKRWCFWSLVLGLLAGVLCRFSKDEGWIPSNRYLWSLSFVLANSSISFLFLILCYFVSDVWKIWRGFPFVQCGMNSLFLYLGHRLYPKALPFYWQIGLMNTHFMLLLRSISIVTMWIFVGLYLYQKKLFFTL